MSNDLNDIKNILETEQTQKRTKKELENTLFIELYNFIKTFKGQTNGAILYIGLSENKESFCNMIANNQEEYNFLILNYTKIYNKIKKAFEIDAKQEQEEKKQTKTKKEPLTIFGIHWALALLMFPLAFILVLFDDLK